MRHRKNTSPPVGYGASIFQSPARWRKLHEREKALQKRWMTIFPFHKNRLEIKRDKKILDNHMKV